MTHAFFGLNAAPFSAAPNPQTYFAAGSSEQARAALARCLLNAEGVAMLVGAPGLGKTTLLGVLAQQLVESFDLAVLSAGHLTTRRSLLQSILYELQMPCVERDEGDMRLALLDRLSLADAAPLVVLCDEAHTLPQRLLEELRLLNNVVRNGVSKVRLLLVGNPSLDERLSHPKLETLQQRIATRCYLHAWNRAETREFVRSRIYHVGGVPEQIFTHDALEAIFRATDGIPRLVTQVASHALSLAEEQGRHTLDKSMIEAAWADLQQLPPPSKPESIQFGKPEMSGSVIEFGILGDEESAPSLELTDDLDAPAIARRTAELDDEEAALDGEILSAPRLFAGTEVDLDSVEFSGADEYDGADFDPEEAELNNDDLQELESPFADSTPFRPRVAAALEEELGEDNGNESTAECELELLPPLTEQVMLRQIETVSRHLERLECDYQSGPENEIELTWEGGNPFSEAFLEEEVVLDPFLEQSLDIFDNKPLVNALAGKQVGRSEERVPTIHAFVPKSVPTPAACAPAAPVKLPDAPANKSTEQPNPTSAGLESIELVFAAPGQAANVANVIAPPAADCKVGGACGNKCRTSQFVQLDTKLPETMHIASPQPANKPVAAPQAKTTEAHDEIVIDDGSEGSEHESRPMVKRQEYRTLFSKLKRG